MKFANAKRLDRKSGESPTIALHGLEPVNAERRAGKHWKRIIIVPRTPPRFLKIQSGFLAGAAAC
jgi:hypothetical protein